MGAVDVAGALDAVVAGAATVPADGAGAGVAAAPDATAAARRAGALVVTDVRAASAVVAALLVVLAGAADGGGAVSVAGGVMGAGVVTTVVVTGGGRVVVVGAGRISSSARAGVPGAGTPPAFFCVAMMAYDPGGAPGTVTVNEMAPVVSGRPDHSTGPVVESRWTTTGSALGAPPWELENPFPVPATWAPGAADVGLTDYEATTPHANAALMNASTSAVPPASTPVTRARRRRPTSNPLSLPQW